MAFPTVVSTSEYQLSSAGDPLPTFTQTTGDLVIIWLSIATAQTTTIDDSFTELENSGGNNDNLHIYWKILDGSEGGNAQVTLGTNAKAAAISYNIQGFDSGNAPSPSAVALNAGSTAPDASSETPSGGAKDYLWITGFSQDGGEEADDDTWCTAAPTDYGTLLQKTSGVTGAASSNCMVATAQRNLNAASEDAGAFTTTQSLAWEAMTVAVYPAASTPKSFPNYPRHRSTIIR